MCGNAACASQKGAVTLTRSATPPTAATASSTDACEYRCNRDADCPHLAERGLVNIEYALIPVFGWAMCLFSWVIIRQWPRQAQKTMQKVESFLQQGGNLWISIEGRRSEDGSLSPYKKGPVVLAINARAKIVPVIHSGVRDCLPYGKWQIRPGKVTIRYLKAIPTEDMQYDDRQEVVYTLRTLAEQKLFGDLISN